MRSKLLLIVGAALLVGGCSSTATNNANIRGTNTNTGYVTNSETNAKPTVPANTTNIEPPSITNSNTNSNSRTNTNSNSNSNR